MKSNWKSAIETDFYVHECLLGAQAFNSWSVFKIVEKTKVLTSPYMWIKNENVKKVDNFNSTLGPVNCLCNCW